MRAPAREARAVKLNRRRMLLTILLACGAWHFGQAAWIHAKAVLAQLLLEAAWAETLDGGKEVRPWPWADTWPVCRLSVPRLGLRRIVLAGASGASLAFGPGLLLQGASPGEAGHIVIAGHRDTHFEFLREIKRGDLIEVESPVGHIQTFTVSSLEVVDARTEGLSAASSPVLTLVTCFPFDALRPGGDLRFVVTAIPYGSYESKDPHATI